MGPRTQTVRALYLQAVQDTMFNYQNLDIIEAGAEEILFKDNRVVGVIDSNDNHYTCGSVVVTAGTFLNGKIYMGEEIWDAGRLGEEPSKNLSTCLQQFGFKNGAIKNGNTCNDLMQTVLIIRVWMFNHRTTIQCLFHI